MVLSHISFHNLGKWSNLTFAYFSDGWEKTTNQIFHWTRVCTRRLGNITALCFTKPSLCPAPVPSIWMRKKNPRRRRRSGILSRETVCIPEIWWKTWETLQIASFFSQNILNWWYNTIWETSVCYCMQCGLLSTHVWFVCINVWLRVASWRMNCIHKRFSVLVMYRTVSDCKTSMGGWIGNIDLQASNPINN